jgi:hypothetical protein
MDKEGTAIAKAMMRFSTVPKGKKNKAATTIMARGTKKLVIENKDARLSLPCNICVFNSKPMWKIIKKRAIDETARRGSFATTNPRTEGPIIMPLNISPTTEGKRILSKSSPTRSAAANTIRTSVMIPKSAISFSPHFVG